MIAAPHFPEQDIVVEMRELGCELAERVTSGGLDDFLLCHGLQCYWNKKDECEDAFHGVVFSRCKYKKVAFFAAISVISPTR